MKTAALLSLALAASLGSADAAGHVRSCKTGCAHNACAATPMVATYDELVKTNNETGAGPKSNHPAPYTCAVKTSGNNANCAGKVTMATCTAASGAAAADACVATAAPDSIHVPFFCKVSTGRRLAAHVQMKLRVAVFGSSKTQLHPMTEAHWIDYVQVVDATPKGRQLAAHAKTLLYMNGWEAEEVKAANKNAGFDFNLLKADGVTHLKAAEHCNLHGLWWSAPVAVADIQDCPAKMTSAANGGRRLASHEFAFPSVKNHADGSACPVPEPMAPSPKTATSGSDRTSIAGTIAAAATVLISLFF